MSKRPKSPKSPAPSGFVSFCRANRTRVSLLVYYPINPFSHLQSIDLLMVSQLSQAYMAPWHGAVSVTWIVVQELERMASAPRAI